MCTGLQLTGLLHAYLTYLGNITPSSIFQSHPNIYQIIFKLLIHIVAAIASSVSFISSIKSTISKRLCFTWSWPRHRQCMQSLRSGLGPSFSPPSRLSQSLSVMSISGLCNHLLVALQAPVGTRDQRACINQLSSHTADLFRQRPLPQLRPANASGGSL